VSPTTAKSFHVETIGCQMNEQDSLRMARQLTAAGFRRAASREAADILVVNTCCIRHKAEEKVYSLLGRVRGWKGGREGRILVVAGCVAQYEGRRLQGRMPHVDIVLGPHQVSRIDTLVRRHMETGARAAEVSLIEGTVDDLECPGVSYANGLRAFVTIMEGCDNFCSYCIVPYVRGRERSRPVSSLRREVCNLVAAGVREVTLIGQNVNAYRAPDAREFRFADLLRELGTLRGLDRLRFTTSNPKDLSSDLVRCFGEVPALCEQIHLPVQSGSDRILALMNRKYTLGDYLEKIAALRRQCPGMALSTDVIVGFPGEGETDFLRTMELVKTVRFDNIFSFKFSPRQGTRAASLEDSVPEPVKAERLERLQRQQRAIVLRSHRAMVGQVFEVLTEGRSRDGGLWMGRTRTNKVVNFHCDRDVAGQSVRVRISRGCQNSLQGTELGSAPAGLESAGRAGTP